MSVEGESKLTDQQSESIKTETPDEILTGGPTGLATFFLEKERLKANKQDESKKTQIRDELSGERVTERENIKKYLHEYLGFNEGDIEKIKLLEAMDLPQNYQAQREALHDERLDRVTIAIVPDALWIKGSQPSESNAEKQLILIKESYFEARENPDEIAWMCHELAHCQNLLEAESPEEYQDNMRKFAFDDLKLEHPYPNNPVELHAFTKQFQYLKEQGKSREGILTMLGEYYGEQDFPFFNRLLDGVYGQ